MNARYSCRGFTLIELLIVIGIIAVLAIVVFLVLNPAELLKQSRDSARLSDLSVLNSAIGIFNVDTRNGSLGAASTIYVSIPDPAATSSAGDQCQGLSLPTSSSNFSYHCASSANYRNVDGTGWIPVNFKLISSGAPFGNLPADPSNSTSSRLYYSYVTNGTQWEITSPMEATKNKLGAANDKVSTDAGANASLAEQGTNLTLQPMDIGDASLVGFWRLSEGNGTVAYDYSGSNATGAWNGTAAGIGGTYYVAGNSQTYAGSFNGTNDFVNIATSSVLSNFTITAWINPTSLASRVEIADYSDIFFNIQSSNICMYVWGVNSAYVCGTTIVPTNTWSWVAITFDGSTEKIFYNGLLNGSSTLSGTPAFNNPPSLGVCSGCGYSSYFPGSIDDVRIYNRALSTTEIQALYKTFQ